MASGERSSLQYFENNSYLMEVINQLNVAFTLLDRSQNPNEISKCVACYVGDTLDEDFSKDCAFGFENLNLSVKLYPNGSIGAYKYRFRDEVMNVKAMGTYSINAIRTDGLLRNYHILISLDANGYDSSQEPAFFNNILVRLDCIIIFNQDNKEKTLRILSRALETKETFQTDFCFLNPQKLSQIPAMNDLDFDSNDGTWDEEHTADPFVQKLRSRSM